MKSILQRIIYLTLTLTLTITACTTSTAPPPPTLPPPTSIQVRQSPTEAAFRSQDEVEVWSEDLDFFMKRLETFHPDPFYRVSEDEYLRSINDLKSRLPTLTDEQIIVELARIVAFIDGHSRIDTLGDPVNFRHYPLRLYLFSDGLFIVGAQEPYENLTGGRIIQIGNSPIENALEAVAPLIPHDNPMGILLGSPSWLMRPEVLLALGIINSVDKPQIVVEMPDGTMQIIDPAPVSWASYREWAGGDAFGNGPVFGLPERPEPLYLSRAGSDPFWTTYLEDTSTLYIQYNRVQSGVDSLVSQINGILDQQEVERVILDLRLNPGGNNTTYGTFLNLLSTNPEINRPGRFFTIIGRQTFSAAANFTTELENQTHTIFVGEPMGGSPNLFGDVVPVILPNSNLRINISARYWEKSTPEDDRVWIAPDIPTPLSSQDFFNNIDPAIEAILAFETNTGYTPGSNPILEPNVMNVEDPALREWESTDVRDPYVLEFEGRYFMFYAGQDANGAPSIGYATSQNGRKWYRSDQNPVLSGSGFGFDSYGVTAPVVRVENGQWVMYYAAIETEGGRSTSIGRATAESPNGPWIRSDTPIIKISESPAWDSLSITPGSVIDVNDRMRLYYSGFSEDGQIGIGYAESANGISWAKRIEPVMTGANPGEWDEIVYAPFVQIRDGVWEMFYHGDPISSRSSNEIGLGLGTSSDGVSWVHASEPFLVSRDARRFPHTPAALSVGDFIYVYYASVATGGSSGQIEIAILPK